MNKERNKNINQGNNKIKSHDNYNAFESTNQMVNFYNIADFVIGRSGAGVTAECFFKELPMLLIPLQNKASRGDQLLNAKYYKNQGVAKIIEEKQFNPSLLLNEIYNFNNNLDNYKNKYKKLIKENGKMNIYRCIYTYMHRLIYVYK